MSIPAALQVEGLSFSYGDRKALDDVRFEVGSGEIFGLLGPNGGGKTTLFRILSTLLPPASGTARVFGKDVVVEPLEVRKSIGVVFQNQSLDRRLSVQENLTYQGMLYGITGAELKRRILFAAESTGIGDRLKDKVEKLSGGLRQRTELAKSLLHQPQLLLLDEPSTGVDPGVRLDFWRYLEKMRAEQGSTVLLTTHLLEEADKCDRLAILDRGRIIATGTPAELKSRIGGDIVSLGSADIDGVVAGVEQHLGIKPQVLQGQVRFEHAHGPEIVAQIMRQLPASVDSVSVSRPTLEDVFIRLTGHGFSESQPPA